MEGGPPRFTPDFTCPTLLGSGNPGEPSLSPTGLSPSPAALSSDFAGRSAREGFCNSLGGPQPSPLPSRNPPRATPAGFNTREVWAVPRSLAATRGISTSPFGGRARLPKETGVDFSSSRYWDVSLRGVRLRRLCIRRRMPHLVGTAGCPIRESPDHSLLSGSPRLIAAGHALHRLRLPRDPPSALTILT